MQQICKFTEIMKGISILMLAALSLFGCKSKPESSWEQELLCRQKCDFTATRADVEAYIRKYIPEVSAGQIDAWTANRRLESMLIDSQVMYFRNAAANLFRVDPECRAIKAAKEGVQESGYEEDKSANIAEVKAAGSVLAAPKRMKVRYTLSVKPDIVPAGEIIRCWLPFPRRDVKRQTGVKFISSSPGNPYFSKPESAHSTLYLEQKAVAEEAAVFVEEFEYVSMAERHEHLREQAKAYDKESVLYKEYTAERSPHMLFTPRIRALADSLTKGIENPVEQARIMFYWVDANLPWASSIEYSTIENLSDYTLDIAYGDCGRVTMLFLTMCRYKGIPAHFQSGFMTHPHENNMHDWGEIYFEGVGWVPVDQSFGGDYYFGGIDSWRMVVNNDYGKALDPAKKFTRSETVDFQRGEVEWRGGNLYFPAWNWDIEIEYL